MTEPTPAVWPTAHQAIQAGQSPAIPGPPSAMSGDVEQTRDAVFQALDALPRVLPFDDVRSLLAVTISLNGTSSRRAVLSEGRAAEIADDVIAALREIGAVGVAIPPGQAAGGDPS